MTRAVPWLHILVEGPTEAGAVQDLFRPFWVFAAAEEVADLAEDEGLGRRIRADVRDADGPEGVNDGPGTAPSKRLLRYWPAYSKTVDGPLAVAALGMPELRRRCPHLDAWLAEIERRAR